MPMHIRTTVRDVVAAALDSSVQISDLKTQIYKARSRPVGLTQKDETAIEILIPRENSTRFGTACGDSAQYERSIVVNLIGYCSAVGEDNVVGKADDLALLVELAMHQEETFGGVVQELSLESTDFALDSNAYANANFVQTWRLVVSSSLQEMNETNQE